MKKKVNKQTINSVLQDSGFLGAFKNQPIRLVAPASGCDPKLIKTLEQLRDLSLHIPKDLLNTTTSLRTNTDAQRFQQLKEALLDKSSNIIWALRGGYGSARLIDQLTKMKKPKKEKIFIGFSDITALHLFFSQHWKWKTIHANGLTGLLDPKLAPSNFKAIAQIIAQKTSSLTMKNLKPLNERAQKAKKISGPLTGGNTTLIQTSIGTGWQIDTFGKILFLEDVNEKAYKIDRTLQHLRQANLFKKVKAIVFGSFSDPFTNTDIPLKRFSSEINLPVFKTDQFGHSNTNHPLIYNAQSEITPFGKKFVLKMNITE